MARSANVSAENNFVRGLITETTALKFPENACTETFNCVFDETGRITRRLGLDLEPDGIATVVAPLTNEAFSEYRWDAVAGNGNRSLFVQQQGSNLYFYDISTNTVIGSSADAMGFISLESFEPAGTPLNSEEFPCQYAAGNGDLIITSEAIEPLLVTFDEVNLTVNAEAILLKVRDFQGLDDGKTLTERPVESVATLKTDEPRHYYNIINQGWHATDALSQWDTARSDMPSNADYVALYRSSETDAFDNALITSQGPGNRPAPKGHFLLTPWNVDRTQAMIDEGFTGADVDPASAEYNLTSYEFILMPPASPTVATYPVVQDGTNNKTSAACADCSPDAGAMLVGKNFLNSGNALPIVSAKLYGSNNVGFVTGGTPEITAVLYGKQGFAPTTPADGTVLGAAVFNDTADESAGRSITSTDPVTAWHHAWITFGPTSGATSDIKCAQLEFYGYPLDPTNASTHKRPRSTEFFAGRAWYAGIDALNLNGSIFFSQIVQQRDQLGKCYQQNDPTAEDFSDLLPDDGGVIKVPEIGSVYKLFAYQASLVVIASNGVWLISGTAGGFAANDYTVRKISSQGMQSPLSVTNVNGIPVWWGDDGIFTLTYSAEFDSFSVVSATEQTIRSFYLDIPSKNRSFAKGAYDSANGIVYWLYNDTDDLQIEDYYTYNSVLVFNTISKAFYPWTLSEFSDLLVRGVSYIQDATRNEDGVVKYTFTVDTGSNNDMLWAEVIDTTYTDWVEVSNAYGGAGVDYESYFITGYKIHGDSQRFFQSNYVFVFLDDLAQGSCRMQGVWDWTISGNSGKWSSLQQIYNSNLLHRSVNFRRLKVRGKGRALQLRFESESTKPFSITGWSIWETSNAGL